jgi:hypothetical protein
MTLRCAISSRRRVSASAVLNADERVIGFGRHGVRLLGHQQHARRLLVEPMQHVQLSDFGLIDPFDELRNALC